MTGAFFYLSFYCYLIYATVEKQNMKKNQGEDRGWHVLHQKMCETASETQPKETSLELIWIKRQTKES